MRLRREAEVPPCTDGIRFCIGTEIRYRKGRPGFQPFMMDDLFPDPEGTNITTAPG